MKPSLLIATVIMLAGSGVQARSGEVSANELMLIHEALRKAPDASLVVGTTRYALVNDRFEECISRKTAKREGRYIKCVTPAEVGWSVTVLTPEGVRLLDATSLDPAGSVLHGECTYYDEHRTLRAQGHYANGLKTGTWTRFDARGKELPDKVYFGEDWDVMQVRVGVSTMSRSLEPDRIPEF